MDETNVNNLNSIPNFGHGLPEDGVVQAGITDIPGDIPTEVIIKINKIKTMDETIQETPVEAVVEAPVEAVVETPVEAPAEAVAETEGTTTE